MSAIVQIFLECARAVRDGDLIRRESKRDKEFHFQNWFERRLRSLELPFDPPARNTYPDFRLIDHREGYEVKGLAFPGRVANYDCNSQVPSGRHNTREIFYVFGRYPKEMGTEFPVYDLVICHGDFLNADHNYLHANSNIKGFGSYGDLMIRDRKMYVAPTPFALTAGTAGQVTLILQRDAMVGSSPLAVVGSLSRIETNTLLVGYSADLIKNTLIPSVVPNPGAGTEHRFVAYRNRQRPGPAVSMIDPAETVAANELEVAEEESD
jgi:hypothetical protein